MYKKASQTCDDIFDGAAFKSFENNLPFSRVVQAFLHHPGLLSIVPREYCCHIFVNLIFHFLEPKLFSRGGIMVDLFRGARIGVTLIRLNLHNLTIHVLHALT